MHIQHTLLNGLVLSSQCLLASAGHFHHVGLEASRVLGRRSEHIEDQLRRHAQDMIEHFHKRQQPSATASAAIPSLTPASGDASKVDLNKWNMETEAACEKATDALNGQASNPTGMAVCYNLPFLDNSTGVFEAELRLYNVSAPIDPWIGVRLADISMTLSYLGATVQMNNGTVMKRDSFLSWPTIKGRDIEGQLVERQDTATPTATGTPKPSNEIKVLNYVGKINSNLMGSAMSK
jgi:hypothetical protein